MRVFVGGSLIAVSSKQGSGSWFQVSPLSALLRGHLAAIPVWGIACERLALAIAFVFGPDGHDVARLHGERSPVCLFNA